MQRRLYAILAIFAASLVVIANTPISSSKYIDVQYNHLTKDAKKQIDCLADNIYHEAGYEPEQGKVAVAMVTLNRLQDPRYPKDICSVVKQRVNYTCQFSWFCENKQTNRQRESYEQARQVALHVYANYELMRDVTHGALFYHADYVRPNWRGLEKTTVIGRHIFYKEK